MKVKFIEEPIEQDVQLHAWGLTRAPLVEAVLWARTFYNDCTSFDPKGFHFSVAYARAALTNPASRRPRQFQNDALPRNAAPRELWC